MGGRVFCRPCLKFRNMEAGMKRKRVSYAKYGYLFCVPFVIAFLIFSLYPIIYTMLIGFTDLKGLGVTDVHFLKEDPFKNFKTILSNNSFQIAFKNTWKMWIINFVPQIVLALTLAAWFTDTRSKIKGQGFFKVVFYLPNIITAATVAILFAAFFGHPMGPVNDIFMSLGWSDKPIYFLRSKAVAQGVIEFIQFWMWYGYTMIVLVSGILGISPEIFEVAEVDGANRVQTFFYVTIPNLKTILLFTLVTSLIGGLQMFDIPQLFIAKQGPDNATLTTSVFIYNQAFSGSYLYNRAAAASMIMFLIICVASAFMFMMLRDKEEIELHKLMKQQEKAYRLSMKQARREEKAK